MLRAGERTTANAPWGSLVASSLVCEGARARTYRIVRGILGGFAEGGGGGEIQGPYFIHGDAVVVRGAEKKSEGSVRENSLFG